MIVFPFMTIVKKIDTSLFVQRPYLRTIYIESIKEEDFDLKIQYRNNNSLDPVSIRETCRKNYVVNLFIDRCILKKTLLLIWLVKTSRMQDSSK